MPQVFTCTDSVLWMSAVSLPSSDSSLDGTEQVPLQEEQSSLEEGKGECHRVASKGQGCYTTYGPSLLPVPRGVLTTHLQLMGSRMTL